MSTTKVIFKTNLGWIGLLLVDGKVAELTFGWETKEEASQRLPVDAKEVRPSDSNVADIVDRLKAYASGEAVDLAEIPVVYHATTEFKRTVLQECQRIPCGETLTYGELAKVAGSPQASRAVGNTMATNKIPLIIPCHRVVGSAGGLGGFSAPQGLDMKKRLLAMEKAMLENSVR